MNDFEIAAGRIWSSRQIVDDFNAICACGGRFAGTASEDEARALLTARLSAIAGAPVRRESVAYRGWTRGACALTLATGQRFPATALGRSPATAPGGLRAPLLDLGRGTPGDFALAHDRIKGRIVLVRHEYMLGSGHIHRRRKYEMAKAAGAAGFLIAYNRPGTLLVTGSAGLGTEGDLPCAGTSFEAGETIAAAPKDCEATLAVGGSFADRVAENLFVDLPGRTPEWVVLSAHLDGHDLAQSAIDNGSGLAAVLAVAAALRDLMAQRRRGIRVALFNVEEWALIGSRDHLAGLSPQQRSALAFNVNLDSVAGSPHLAAMTSGIAAAESLVDAVNAEHGFGIRMLRPFMGNSDHGNFIRMGIPALRLCAGLDEPESNLRYQLTAGDTADKVAPSELKAAASAAAALVLRAADMEVRPLGRDDVVRITGEG